MRHKIYVSGPMTGYPSKNFGAFNKAAAELRKRGYHIINPAELDMEHPRQTWAECLRRDIVALMRCNGVATLPNWKHSRGAQLEVYIAQALNWPVHSINYWRKK